MSVKRARPLIAFEWQVRAEISKRCVLCVPRSELGRDALRLLCEQLAWCPMRHVRMRGCGTRVNGA